MNDDTRDLVSVFLAIGYAAVLLAIGELLSPVDRRSFRLFLSSKAGRCRGRCMR